MAAISVFVMYPQDEKLRMEIKMIFGIPALRKMAQHQAHQEFTDVESIIIFGAQNIIYSGHLNYCNAYGELPKVKPIDLYEYLSSHFEEESFLKETIQPLIKEFNDSKDVESILGKRPAAELSLEEEKKT